MSKKSIGGICGIISLVAVVIFLIWGMFGNAWDKSWIVFVISGVACACVSIIANIKNEKKNEGKPNEDK